MLGWGAKAVLASGRLARSLPPVIEEDVPEHFHWSHSQWHPADQQGEELRDSLWELMRSNSEKNIDLHSRSKVTMLEVAA